MPACSHGFSAQAHQKLQLNMVAVEVAMCAIRTLLKACSNSPLKTRCLHATKVCMRCFCRITCSLLPCGFETWHCQSTVGSSKHASFRLSPALAAKFLRHIFPRQQVYDTCTTPCFDQGGVCLAHSKSKAPVDFLISFRVCYS